MGFRFRKRIKIFKGFGLNLTHKGINSGSIRTPFGSINTNKNFTIPSTRRCFIDYLLGLSFRFSACARIFGILAIV